MNILPNTPDNVLGLSLSGVLTKQDIGEIGKLIHNRIEIDGTFGLVIDMSSFEDMTAGAIKEDIKLESSLLGQIKHFPKIAFVSDRKWINAFVVGASKLVPGVDVETFAPDQMQAAIDFATNLPTPAAIPIGRVSEIPTSRPDLLAFEINGKITDKDLHPMIEDLMQRFAQHEHVDLMLRLKDFHGYDLAILKDGSLYKMKKVAMDRVRRYAIVGAKGWMKGVAKAVGPFLDMEIRTFALDQEDEAMAWLNS